MSILPFRSFQPPHHCPPLPRCRGLRVRHRSSPHRLRPLFRCHSRLRRRWSLFRPHRSVRRSRAPLPRAHGDAPAGPRFAGRASRACRLSSPGASPALIAVAAAPATDEGHREPEVAESVPLVGGRVRRRTAKMSGLSDERRDGLRGERRREPRARHRDGRPRRQLGAGGRDVRGNRRRPPRAGDEE